MAIKKQSENLSFGEKGLALATMDYKYLEIYAIDDTPVSYRLY